MADRYQASIDDFDIEMETIEDVFEKSIQVNDFPFRNGALLDDLGMKARHVRLRCYWYNETYEGHIEFIRYVQDQDIDDLFELTHPKYGIIEGKIMGISVRHDDRDRTAEVDITFVESGSGMEEAEEFEDVEESAETEFMEGQDELIELQTGDLGSKLGSLGAAVALGRSLAKAVIDKTKSLTSQVSKLTSALPGGLSGVTAPLTGAVSQASGVAAQARGYIAKADALVTKLRSLP